MFRLISILLFFGLILGLSQAQADPATQVIKLFDEQLVIFGDDLIADAVVRESYTTEIVRGKQDKVILSSTPDGTGIPNIDDYITLNGEFVQSGWFIPVAVEHLTGTWPGYLGCSEYMSVNVCYLPHPHFHPVDVSDVLPVGRSTVTAELWDFGGAYGHTELYLIIVPMSLQ